MNTCETTGQPIEQKGGRGRPRRFANPEAQRLAAILAEAGDLILALGQDDGFTVEARRALRRRLNELTNLAPLSLTTKAAIAARK